jgi:hypothetical protein
MQPPSLLSSLSEITESQGLEAELHPCRAPEPRQALLLLPLRGDDDARASRDALTSSSKRSLLRDPQPLSHRWPPALRGLLPPEPVPPLPLTSGLPHRRAPLPDQPGSPR